MTSHEAEYYEPGDLIFTSEDFAHVIHFKYRKEYCDYCCTRNVHVKQCSQCQHVSYCNKQCQKSAWPLHKLECSRLLHYEVIRDEYDMLLLESDEFCCILEILLLTMRVIRKLKINKGEPFSEIFNGCKITFDDIQSAWEKDVLFARPRTFENTNIVTRWIHDKFADKIVLSDEEIIYAFGRVLYNQAPLKYDKEFGIYLCLGTCFFMRECKSNAVALPNGKLKYEIRATQRIPKGSREKIVLPCVHILDSYCAHCNMAYSAVHEKIECTSCLDDFLSTSHCDRFYCIGVLEEMVLLNEKIMILRKSNITVPSEVRAAVDDLLNQSDVLGITHIARLRLLVWKVLIDPQDLFSVKRSERSVILTVKKVFGEQSYELFTVYSRLTAIYASYKKLKIAKHYKEKRDELGCLYHQMPLNFESDALIKKMELNNVNRK